MSERYLGGKEGTQVCSASLFSWMAVRSLGTGWFQVQKESLQQAEVVAALAKRVEKSELDLKDLQMLMVALQGRLFRKYFLAYFL